MVDVYETTQSWQIVANSGAAKPSLWENLLLD